MFQGGAQSVTQQLKENSERRATKCLHPYLLKGQQLANPFVAVQLRAPSGIKKPGILAFVDNAKRQIKTATK